MYKSAVSGCWACAARSDRIIAAAAAIEHFMVIIILGKIIPWVGRGKSDVMNRGYRVVNDGNLLSLLFFDKNGPFAFRNGSFVTIGPFGL